MEKGIGQESACSFFFVGGRNEHEKRRAERTKGVLSFASCGNIGGKMEVHHKTYIDVSNIQDPEVLLNKDNLEYLCMDCHNSEHHAVNNRRYFISDDGRVIAK